MRDRVTLLQGGPRPIHNVTCKDSLTLCAGRAGPGTWILAACSAAGVLDLKSSYLVHLALNYRIMSHLCPGQCPMYLSDADCVSSYDSLPP